MAENKPKAMDLFPMMQPQSLLDLQNIAFAGFKQFPMVPPAFFNMAEQGTMELLKMRQQIWGTLVRQSIAPGMVQSGMDSLFATECIY